MEGYTGQDIIIFDDLRDTVFAFDDLLKILDNHTGSLIKARYVNKWFRGTHIFITSTKPLNEWYRSMAQQERLKQLYRRINNYVVLEEDRGHFYWKVDHDTGDPIDDLSTEHSPFNPSRLYDELLQSEAVINDEMETREVLAKLKEVMK
jgi:hypothetical protein